LRWNVIAAGNALDPAVVGADVGVHAWVVVAAAADAPRDDANLDAAGWDEQRTARIALARVGALLRVGAHHSRGYVGAAVAKVGAAFVSVDQVDVAELQLGRHGFGGHVVDAPSKSDGLAVVAKVLVERVPCFRKADWSDGCDWRGELQDGNVVLHCVRVVLRVDGDLCNRNAVVAVVSEARRVLAGVDGPKVGGPCWVVAVGRRQHVAWRNQGPAARVTALVTFDPRLQGNNPRVLADWRFFSIDNALSITEQWVTDVLGLDGREREDKRKHCWIDAKRFGILYICVVGFGGGRW